jgi:translation initiation factor 3 subunit D
MGKRRKAIEGQRAAQNATYKKEMKAKHKAFKELACQVNQKWPLVDEIQPLTLSNQPKFIPGTNEILLRAGKVGEYRHAFDSVLKSSPVKFTAFPSIEEERLSTKDIMLDEKLAEILEEDKSEGIKIVASDMALATLMSNDKAYYSWDLVVAKYGDLIYINKREKDEKEDYVMMDLETVGENSITPPPAVIEHANPVMQFNTAANLMREGMKVNHSVQAVCVNKDNLHEFEEPHPFAEDEDQQDLPLHGYTYMKWPFGDKRTLYTRGQLHSFEDLGNVDEDGNKKLKYNNIYAINQWKYTKSAWDSIDTSKTSVLSLELTDNARRAIKWALQSYFAGADNMKLTFTTRSKFSNNQKHEIVGCSTMTTQTFFDLVSYKADEAWSTVKYIVDYFEKMDDGEYLLMRDHIKNTIRVYLMEEKEDEEGDKFDATK